jgi:hypothetical protein
MFWLRKKQYCAYLSENKTTELQEHGRLDHHYELIVF